MQECVAHVPWWKCFGRGVYMSGIGARALHSRAKLQVSLPSTRRPLPEPYHRRVRAAPLTALRRALPPLARRVRTSLVVYDEPSQALDVQIYLFHNCPRIFWNISFGPSFVLCNRVRCVGVVWGRAPAVAADHYFPVKLWSAITVSVVWQSRQSRQSRLDVSCSALRNYHVDVTFLQIYFYQLHVYMLLSLFVSNYGKYNIFVLKPIFVILLSYTSS